jgi:hypothetical protein
MNIDFDKTVQLLESKLQLDLLTANSTNLHGVSSNNLISISNLNLGTASTSSPQPHPVRTTFRGVRSLSQDDDLIGDRHLRNHKPGGSTVDDVRLEINAQLADTLYKRAQAKLLIESDVLNLESALIDAMRVCVDSANYLLSVVNCVSVTAISIHAYFKLLVVCTFLNIIYLIIVVYLGDVVE